MPGSGERCGMVRGEAYCGVVVAGIVRRGVEWASACVAVRNSSWCEIGAVDVLPSGAGWYGARWCRMVRCELVPDDAG